MIVFFSFQAEDGIRDHCVTGVQTCALPISYAKDSGFAPEPTQNPWHKCSTAPHGDVEIRRFRVTHPYHPLFQQAFELVSYRQDWGEDRVWFQDKLGRLHSLPTSWTDAGAVDPFVALAAGRSLFRVADLIELARQIDGWKSERAERTVKENMS